MQHDFHKSLATSKEHANAPWWDQVYRKAFIGFATSHYVQDDGWAQRGGIDRVIVLRSGKTFNVDEKVRTKDWPDFALERYSDRQRQTPGWIQKPLACDFIAYAFVPSQRCYLLPFLTLRAAWRSNGPDWIRAAEEKAKGFSFIYAENHGYTTESVGVPIPVVLKALNDAMLVTWNDEVPA